MPERPSWAVPALILIANVLLLSPMLDCGYIGDDVVSSCAWGWGSVHGLSPLGLMGRDIAMWARHSGRFFPLALLYYPFFSWVRDLLVYRLLGLALVLLNVLLLGRLVHRLTGSRRLGLLAGLVAPAVFQFRLYADPILGFCFMLPLVVAYLLGSLLLLDSYLRSGRRWWLAGSLLLYALGVLTYEVAWPFFLLHLVLAALRVPDRRRLRAAVRKTCPFALLALLFVGVNLFIRWYFQVRLLDSTPGTRVTYGATLDPVLYLVLLGKQTLGALPLSYRLVGLHHPGLFYSPLRALPLAVCVLGVVHLVVFRRLVPRAAAEGPGAPSEGEPGALGPAGLALLGVLLTLLPGALVALSPAHLSHLAWGVCYTPVYVSYFGVALLVLAGLEALARLAARLHRAAAPALAVAAGAGWALLAFLHYDANRMVVDRLNAPPYGYRYPRELVEQALRRGLFQGVPPGSCLLITSRYAWDDAFAATAFFRTHARRPLDVVTPGELLKHPALRARVPGKGKADTHFLQLQLAEEDNVFHLHYDAHLGQEGHAFLGRVNRLTVAHAGLLEASASKALVYVHLPSFSEDFTVTGRWAGSGGPGPGETFAFPAGRLRQLAGCRNWRLCEVPADRPLDLLSLRVHFGPPPEEPPSGSVPRLKTRAELLLRGPDAPLLHAGFADGDFGKGCPHPGVAPAGAFSVEAIFRPAPEQGPWATLLSNHANLEGFSVERGVGPHEFILLLGDGMRYHPVTSLQLPPGRWHYLAAVVRKGELQVHLDGKPLTTVPCPGFRNSPLPVTVGNWVGKDRPFAGQILEVRILGRELSAAEIADNARLVREFLK
jgi:hypothetical protein